MDQSALIEAGKHLYGRWARIADPSQLEFRWDRLAPSRQQNWIDEAEAAIRTYLQLTR